MPDRNLLEAPGPEDKTGSRLVGWSDMTLFVLHNRRRAVIGLIARLVATPALLVIIGVAKVETVFSASSQSSDAATADIPESFLKEY